MTNIASLAAYTPPPVVTPVTVAPAAPVAAPVAQTPSADTTPPVTVPVATNADVNVRATYNALANESSSTIRGTNVNTSA